MVHRYLIREFAGVKIVATRLLEIKCTFFLGVGGIRVRHYAWLLRRVLGTPAASEKVDCMNMYVRTYTSRVFVKQTASK